MELIELGTDEKILDALQIAEDAVKEFQIFRGLNIRVQGIDLYKTLKASSACFRLVITHLQLKLGIVKADDIDYQSVKDLLILAYKLSEPNLLCFMLDNYHSNVVWYVEDIKIKRIFLMLQINNIQGNLDHPGTCPNHKLKYQLRMLLSELHFLSGYSMVSYLIAMEDAKSNEKQEVREQIFSDVLEILGVQDIYPFLPSAVKTFEQTNMLFNIMTSKLTELRDCYKNCLDRNVSEPSILTELFIQFWSGLNFHTLSCYQKDLQKQFVLAEKSFDLWNQMLIESFSKQNLQEYLLTCPKAIFIFVHAIERNILNFKNVVDFKVSTIMNLNPDESSVEPVIHELNVLRRDAILSFMKVPFMETLQPKTFPDDILDDVNLYIAIQFRSIILKNKKNQKQNLKNSLPYAMKCKQLTGLLEIPEDGENLPEILADLIDSHSFIAKFRKN